MLDAVAPQPQPQAPSADAGTSVALLSMRPLSRRYATLAHHAATAVKTWGHAKARHEIAQSFRNSWNSFSESSPAHLVPLVQRRSSGGKAESGGRDLGASEQGSPRGRIGSPPGLGSDCNSPLSSAAPADLIMGISGSHSHIRSATAATSSRILRAWSIHSGPVENQFRGRRFTSEIWHRGSNPRICRCKPTCTKPLRGRLAQVAFSVV